MSPTLKFSSLAYYEGSSRSYILRYQSTSPRLRLCASPTPHSPHPYLSANSLKMDNSQAVISPGVSSALSSEASEPDHDAFNSVEIVPDHNLQILVQDDTKAVAYLVRANVVENMSEKWRVLVYEALENGEAYYRGEELMPAEGIADEEEQSVKRTRYDKSQTPRIILPLDYPETVYITLLVAHHCFWDLPTTISFELLDQLALHCRIFRTEKLLARVIDPWIERLANQATAEGCLRWLHISWVFQLDCIFAAQLHYFIWNSTNDTLGAGMCGIELPGHDRLGKDLRGTSISAIMMYHANYKTDRIVAAREDLLHSIVKICQHYQDRATFAQHWTCSDDKLHAKCSEQAHVSYLVELQSLDLWPTTPSPSTIGISASELRDRLLRLKTVPYSEQHSSCFLEDFWDEILMVSTRTPSTDLTHRLEKPFWAEHFMLSSDIIGSHLRKCGMEPRDCAQHLGLNSFEWGLNDTQPPFYEGLVNEHEDEGDDLDYEEESEDQREPDDEYLTYSYEAIMEDVLSLEDKRFIYDADVTE
ncbi:hypothetical protein CC80DRAFT_590671 [Byssothecium circinans]|uniref:Uncharacterized protein n=1 Tax=Byssothecium circinans TaxID=147558 RepID=A0A6A5U6F0_9PLEO|nr:hypothetical protein CC80DRAFT_590671 [Byssothecium circinans]